MSVSAGRQSELLDAETVWRDFHARLLGFVARRVPDRNSAEDIVQEAAAAARLGLSTSGMKSRGIELALV